MIDINKRRVYIFKFNKKGFLAKRNICIIKHMKKKRKEIISQKHLLKMMSN